MTPTGSHASLGSLHRRRQRRRVDAAAREASRTASADGRGRRDGDFDVSADGQRFLLIYTDPAIRPTRLDIIVNWVEELRAKLGR
jgi:hypothetical protein